MSKKQEIESIYLGEEAIIDILFTILMNNRAFTEYLQCVAENIAFSEEGGLL